MAATVTPVASANVIASTANPVTYTSMTSGTAAADRISVVAINGRRRATISGVTINGIAATKAIGAVVSSNIIAEIWYCANPSGTTATVVVTFSSATSGAWQVDLYDIKGADLAPTDTDSATNATAAATNIAALTIPTDGVAILCFSNAGDTNAVAWTNATEYTDTNISEIRASSAYTSTPGTPTIIGTSTAGNPTSMAGAAWTPSAGGGPTAFPAYYYSQLMTA